VATNDAPYTLEKTRGYVILCLLPKLNEVQWGDVQQVGNEIIPDLDTLRSPALLVDLSELDYMGSSMVALLVRLWKAVQKKNGRMVVQSEQKMVTEVINIAGLNSLWDVVATREEALAAMRHAPTAASRNGEPTPSWIGPIIGLLAAVAAGWVLWTTQTGDPLFGDAKQSIYLLWALAAIALVVGGFSLLKNAGAARVTGAVILLASLGIAFGGFRVWPTDSAADNGATSDTAGDDQAATVEEQLAKAKSGRGREDDDDEQAAPTTTPKPQTPPAAGNQKNRGDD